MTARVDARIDEALTHNAREQAEHGPGLRYTTRTAPVAKCHTGQHVLETGFGALGVGSMWGPATDEDRADELWSELPAQRCSGWGLGPDGPCDPEKETT